MKAQLAFVLRFTALIGLILSACGQQSAATSAPDAQDPSATAAEPTEVPATPSEEVLVTEIIIDGDSSDWESYTVINFSDPADDQPAGGADLAEGKFFANDKYLYGFVTFHQNGDWNNVAIALGPEGQLTIRQNRHVTIDEETIPIEVVVLETQIEFKVALDLLPAELNNINGITIYGDQEGDSNNTPKMRLAFLDELEPTSALTATNSSTSGLIQSNETWSGEVHITGDIFLANGVTLTIEPGTTVFLASNSDDQQTGFEKIDEYIGGHNDPVGTLDWDQNAILIDGRGGILHFVGTEDEPIVFKPEGTSTSSAQWAGIFIERGTIQYSKVLYAGRTAIQPLGFLGELIEIAHNEVRFYHWAGIDSHTNNVWIHHNVVEGGGHQAISAASENIVEYNIMTHCQNAMFISGVDVIVRNNIAVDCARGLQVAGNLPSGTEISITNNTIVQLQGPPDGWYYQGTLIYPSFEDGWGIGVFTPNVKVTAQNNIIVGPFTTGMNFNSALGSGSVVDYNLIFGPGSDQIGSGSGDHNMFVDPLLTLDMATLRYVLAAGSPAVDAGAPGTLDADGSPADLGAFGGEFGNGW